MLLLCNDNQTLLSPVKPSNRLASPLSASLHTRAGAFKGATMERKRQPEYVAWRHMKERCRCKKTSGFKNWGGRGIKVCDRWENSFEGFLEDVGRKPTSKHTLERIDNDGNYEPGNVRWATYKEQHMNKRTNRLLTFRGESKPLTQWATELGINPSTLSKRILRSSWPVEIALTKI